MQTGICNQQWNCKPFCSNYRTRWQKTLYSWHK